MSGPDDLSRAEDVGIPVCGVNWARLHAVDLPTGPRLLATFGQNAGGWFVCDVDVTAGACKQVGGMPDKAFAPTATAWCARAGRLYVATAYNGHLYAFTPEDDTIEDLGPIDAQHCRFPCRIAVDGKGTVWIGAYPGCTLHRYRPGEGTFECVGRMDDVDQYFYPQVGADGTLAGVVRMTRPHVVVIDAATKAIRAVGPTVDPEGDGRLHLRRGVDGMLYIDSSAGALALRDGEAHPVEHLPPLEPAEQPPGIQEPITTPTFKDGSTAAWDDADTLDFRRVRITSIAGDSRAIDLAWTGGGTRIWMLHGGHGGRVYGSSYLPMRLFSADPESGAVVDHGRCSQSDGEACSMANLDGKLYIAGYRFGHLSAYDPTLPWRLGDAAYANPRTLGRVSPVADRPKAMAADGRGKLWIGATPDYGLTGGTLSVFDPATAAIVWYRDLLPGTSPVSLYWCDITQRMLVGLSIEAGTGVVPTAERGALVRWNVDTHEPDGMIELSRDDVYGVADIESAMTGEFVLLQCANERHVPAASLRSRFVIAYHHTTETKLEFLTDVDTDVVGTPLVPGLVVAPAGHCHLMTYRGLFRLTIEPRRDRINIRQVWEATDGTPTAVGPCIGRHMYFATGHRLRRLDLARRSAD